MRVREPAVAGRFYPSDASELRREVQAHLAAAAPSAIEQPHGVIVPHAGHIYSGPIAASAYVTVSSAQRVVLIGPSHFVPFRGLAAPASDVWRTPLGVVEIDGDRIAELGLSRVEHPHTPEHSLEVQLPFLQEQLGSQWSLVPILVGRATPEEVAAVLRPALADPATLVVVSTDLSHYGRYEQAVDQDRETAEHIVALRWQDIADVDACGAYPLRGLLLARQEDELPIRLLDLRNSGDTAGSHGRVVGYGAFAVGAG